MIINTCRLKDSKSQELRKLRLPKTSTTSRKASLENTFVNDPSFQFQNCKSMRRYGYNIRETYSDSLTEIVILLLYYKTKILIRIKIKNVLWLFFFNNIQFLRVWLEELRRLVQQVTYYHLKGPNKQVRTGLNSRFFAYWRQSSR